MQINQGIPHSIHDILWKIYLLTPICKQKCLQIVYKHSLVHVLPDTVLF